jgi:F0F1-type ATP synthase, subunit b
MANTHHAETHHEASPGLPQLNPDSFVSQIFWLAFVFAALYLMMARSVIPRIREVLTKRQSQIQHDLDAAEKAKADAEAAKASYEAELANAKQKATDEILRAQREIEAHISKAQADVSQKLEAITADSEATIAKQREEALNEIKPMIQELTAQIAKRYLPKAPTKTQINKVLKQLENR